MPRANTGWKRAKGRIALLTARQRTVLDLLVAGATNQQLADHFKVTLNQAKAEVNEVIGRLELSSRQELADFWAWQGRQHSLPLPVLLGAGLLALVIAGLGIAGLNMPETGEHAAVGEFPTATVALATPTATAPPSIVALGLAPDEIAWPAAGADGRLAFVNPAGELLVKPMPSGTPTVVRSGPDHRAPAWAPSGRYLAFIESGHLVVSDERGHLTALTQPGADAAWAWSPTADILAFFSPDGMLLYDAANGAAKVIRGQGAPYPERPGGLYWSPAGTRILYGVYAGYTSPGRLEITELRVYELATGDDHLLLEESLPAKGGTAPLGWSGDGRWVFYREPPSFGNSAWVGSVDVHVIPAAGGSPVTLGTNDGSPERVSAPVGPDVFAYVSGGFRFASDGGRTLRFVSAGSERDLPGGPPGTASAVRFSPNGIRLAVVSMPEPPPGSGSVGTAEMLAQLMGQKLWVQTVGEAAKQLTGDPTYRDEHPVWSRDGRSILFTRIDAAGKASIWRIPATGGTPQLVQDGLGLGARGVTGIYGWIEWTDLLDWWQP